MCVCGMVFLSCFRIVFGLWSLRRWVCVRSNFSTFVTVVKWGSKEKHRHQLSRVPLRVCASVWRWFIVCCRLFELLFVITFVRTKILFFLGDWVNGCVCEGSHISLINVCLNNLCLWQDAGDWWFWKIKFRHLFWWWQHWHIVCLSVIKFLISNIPNIIKIPNLK